ncbi:MAG: phosphoesterase [Pirellulales bacterium]|nr:phosphoesterase [Pirellulales bacterium]MDA7975410.1 phosphoesterase [Pirellulales bacterium]MDA7992796.1 phosphoesterase [Pirellulales bacterium]MEC8737887.1 phosphoesterase [Planctomycetota bacterium]MEE2797820.1 phosphoesterase [Planctomycetota bacterium]
MSSLPQEDVLVVPRSVLEQAGLFQGFCRDVEKYLPILLDPNQTRWMPREKAEEDPSFKQLIPYCLLAWSDPAGATQYFSYTRGGGQGEARLRTKRSIGVGGHIASTDGEHGDNASYEAGMLRELEEEVAISGDFTSRCVGLINDDATPVGSVHLGIVHVFDLQSPQVVSREADLLECGFQSSQDLVADRKQFETWSQIALEAIEAGILH